MNKMEPNPKHRRITKYNNKERDKEPNKTILKKGSTIEDFSVNEKGSTSFHEISTQERKSKENSSQKHSALHSNDSSFVGNESFSSKSSAKQNIPPSEFKSKEIDDESKEQHKSESASTNIPNCSPNKKVLLKKETNSSISKKTIPANTSVKKKSSTIFTKIQPKKVEGNDGNSEAAKRKSQKDTSTSFTSETKEPPNPNNGSMDLINQSNDSIKVGDKETKDESTLQTTPGRRKRNNSGMSTPNSTILSNTVLKSEADEYEFMNYEVALVEEMESVLDYCKEKKDIIQVEFMIENLQNLLLGFTQLQEDLKLNNIKKKDETTKEDNTEKDVEKPQNTNASTTSPENENKKKKQPQPTAPKKDIRPSTTSIATPAPNKGSVTTTPNSSSKSVKDKTNLSKPKTIENKKKTKPTPATKSENKKKETEEIISKNGHKKEESKIQKDKKNKKPIEKENENYDDVLDFIDDDPDYYNLKLQLDNVKSNEKRSRSATPNKLSAPQLMVKLHNKLREKQKPSEEEILKKAKEKQKKAEEIRELQVKEKLQLALKNKERQQIVKERQANIEEEKSKKNQDYLNKLSMADVRYNQHLNDIRSKAKLEKEKVDEITLFINLQNDIKRDDIEIKIAQSQHRRSQIMNNTKQRLNEHHLKEEAAEKKRQALKEEARIKLQYSEMKKKSAEERRNKIIQEKKKIAEEDSLKAAAVSERKRQKFDQVIDIFNFLSNQDNLWNYIESGIFQNGEEDEEEEKLNNEPVYTSRFERIKTGLKKDQEKLNKIFELKKEGFGNNSKKLKRESFDIVHEEDEKEEFELEEKNKLELQRSFYSTKDLHQAPGYEDQQLQEVIQIINEAKDNQSKPVQLSQTPSSSSKAVKKRNRKKRKKERLNQLKEQVSNQDPSKQSNQLSKITEENKNSSDVTNKTNRTEAVKAEELSNAGATEKEKKDDLEINKKKLNITNSLPQLTPASEYGVIDIHQREIVFKHSANDKYLSKKIIVEDYFPSQQREEKKQVHTDQKKEETENNTLTSLAPKKIKEEIKKAVSSKFKTLVPTKSEEKKSISSKRNTIKNLEDKKSVPTKKDNFGKKKVVGKILTTSPKKGEPEEEKKQIPKLSEQELKLMEEEKKINQMIEKDVVSRSLNFLDGNEKILELTITNDEFIKFILDKDFTFYWCKLCNSIIYNKEISSHLDCKSHIKSFDSFNSNQDTQYTSVYIYYFKAVAAPDINMQLLEEKSKVLKKKSKKIKQNLALISIPHEKYSCLTKESSSSNKQRLQKLCIELEKCLNSQLTDYEAIEKILKEILRILDTKKEPDLHLLRQLKYMTLFMDICKRTFKCRKNEVKDLGRLVDLTIKIINLFSTLRENRNYLLTTNRLIPIIELFLWSLSKNSKFLFGMPFVVNLLQILTLNAKQRVTIENLQFKENFMEFILCSNLLFKIKQKIIDFMNEPLDLSEIVGSVPLIILKSLTFLEAMTSTFFTYYNLFTTFNMSQEKKRGTSMMEEMLFNFEYTGLFGVIPFLSTLLLSKGPIKEGTKTILPQTIFSLVLVSIKVLNNCSRIHFSFVQDILVEQNLLEEVYHLLNYLLSYAIDNLEDSEENKELLHETILFIGYSSLDNLKIQNIMNRGESTLVQKLVSVPIQYFCDKKLEELLFPTLIAMSYQNARNKEILCQELDIKMLQTFLKLKIDDDLKEQEEEEKKRKNGKERTLSFSSTSSSAIDIVNANSPAILFQKRFPRVYWKKALEFLSVP